MTVSTRRDYSSQLPDVSEQGASQDSFLLYL